MSLDAEAHLTTRVNVQPGACGLECQMEIRAQGNESVLIKITSTCEKVTSFAKELASVELKEALAPAHKNRVLEAGGLRGCHPSCPVPLAVIKGVEVECGAALPRTATIELEKM